MSVNLQHIPKVVLAVCCALIAYQAAQLTWALYPSEQDDKYVWTPPAKKSQVKNKKIDSQALKDAQLFGQYQGQPLAVADPENVPKTRLNISLVGIVAASDPNYSSVIIEHKGEQDSYFMNSKITGTNATVTKIFQDRIIITVKGEQQTLILDGVEPQKKSATAKSEERKKSKKGRGKKIDLDREELLSDPGKLTDYIKISPVREGEEMKGYRVKPGKDSSLFEEAGLVSGDLAVELNGVDLTDMSQAMGLMKELPNMTDISLTVDREGELHELFFRIP